MAYRFSSLAGRLVASAQFAAYRPQGFQVAAVVSNPPVFSSNTVKSLRDTHANRASSTAVEKTDPMLFYEEELTPQLKTILHAHQNDLIWRSSGVDLMGANITRVLVFLALGIFLFETHKLYDPAAHKK